MSPIQGIVETALYVDDLDRAERFYGDILGLERIAREDGRHVFYRVGDHSVLLLFLAAQTLTGDHLPVHGAAGPGHCAFGIAADALGDWRERLARHGVTIEAEQDWPRGGRSIYFRDPVGNLLELLTPGLWGLASGW
jgi:catechol 2,3-dioxygenase-like lactoylglutathione lyase family enzyme